MNDQLVVFRRGRDRQGRIIAPRDRWLRLPKDAIDVEWTKNDLEVVIQGEDGYETVRMWQESRTHLLVPREYLSDDELHEMTGGRIRIVDTPHVWESIDFIDRIVPRDESQELAWQALQDSNRGTLVLACGKGKTVLGVKKIAQMGAPAMVIAPQAHILTQWRETLDWGLGLSDARVGWVRGQSRDWKKDVVLATIHTLARHHLDWPEEFKRRFGLIIFDEVHHLPAPWFCRTAPLFFGNRIGLTATPDREDGLEYVYFHHVGEPFYIDMTQDLDPNIFFVRIGTWIDFDEDEVKRQVTDRNGDFNPPRFRKYLCRSEDRNDIICNQIEEEVRQGRKVLALSHVVDHVRLLKKRFPGSIALHGKVDARVRIQLLRSHKIVFATTGVAQEAMDDAQIETVMFMTPFRAKRALIQGMGRALRRAEGKTEARVIFFDDYRIPSCRRAIAKLRKHLRDLGHPYRTVSVGPQGRGWEEVKWSRRKKGGAYQKALSRYGVTGRAVPGATCARSETSSCSERGLPTPGS